MTSLLAKVTGTAVNLAFYFQNKPISTIFNFNQIKVMKVFFAIFLNFLYFINLPCLLHIMFNVTMQLGQQGICYITYTLLPQLDCGGYILTVWIMFVCYVLFLFACE